MRSIGIDDNDHLENRYGFNSVLSDHCGLSDILRMKCKYSSYSEYDFMEKDYTWWMRGKLG